MSTRMTEADWAHTLEVFRACLPRRGRKAADDRLFLEAMHFFRVENVRWRALPERFGPWNSVWKRFDRLSKAGVFEAFFDTLASMSTSAHLIQRSRCSTAPSCVPMSQRPAQKGAAGSSARPLAGRVHDENPCQIRCIGNHDRFRPDWRRERRRAALPHPPRHRAGHRAPRRHRRQRLCQQGEPGRRTSRGIAPVIPYKANEKDKPTFFAKVLYRARARIEQGIGVVKRFKRVALRCEKTARNYRSIVSFAAGPCLIKFVHTA